MQYRLSSGAMAQAAVLVVCLSHMPSTLAHFTSPSPSQMEQTLPAMTVTASADASADGLPVAFTGGQVARGARMGFLGNRDFLDTPFSTSSYTQELMKDQQTRSVADVLQNDPSVRIARGFGNFQELYIIRGLPLNSDDLAYNGLYGLLPRQYVAAELLERVEVLRGASAFLNGMTPGGSGIGGTINLLPKRASNTPVTQVSSGWETGGQLYQAADIGRRVGPDERLGLRINAAHRTGGTGVDWEHRTLGLMSLGLDYRSNVFRLSGDFGYQKQSLRRPRPSVFPGTAAIPAAPDAVANFAQPWSYSDERDLFGTVRAEFDLADHTMAWMAYGMRFGTENNALANLKLTNADGNATVERFDNARKDNIRTAEAGIRSTVNVGATRHELSATASLFRQESRNAYAVSTNTSTSPLFTNIYAPISHPLPPLVTSPLDGGDLTAPHITRMAELTSVAVADTISLPGNRVQVTLGVRHQRVNNIGMSYLSGARNAYYNQSAVTPMAGILTKITSQLSLYGNYVEGLQPGSVAGISAVNVGQILAPVKSRQKEIGAKFDAGNAGWSAALFTLSQPIAGLDCNNWYGLNGEQRIRGAELTVFGMPVRGFRVLGGLTLLDARQAMTRNGDTDGNYVAGVPTTQLNANVDWDIPGFNGLTANARAVHTSRQFADAANDMGLPAWTRFDAGLRYVTSIGANIITLRGRIDNVLNRNYWASTGGGGSNYLVLGNPRTLTLSAAIDF